MSESDCRVVDGVVFNSDLTILLEYPSESNDMEYHVPEGVKRICAGAFEYCPHLVRIHLPSSMEMIETGAFVDTPLLSEITVDPSNESFGTLDNSFVDRNRRILLKHFNPGCARSCLISGAVEIIGRDSFNRCDTLSVVHISEWTKAIENDAFHNCKGLECVVFQGADPPLMIGISFNFDDCDRDTLRVRSREGDRFMDDAVSKQVAIEYMERDDYDPLEGYAFEDGFCNNYDLYEQCAENPKDFFDPRFAFDNIGVTRETTQQNYEFSRIDEERKTAAIYLFDGLHGLERVTVPGRARLGDELYRIDCVESGAFRDFEAEFLREVEFSEGIERIDCMALLRCQRLKTVRFPDSLSTLEAPVQYGCIELEEYIVSDSNKHFRSIDGVLYDEAIATLLSYPPARKGDVFEVPDSVRRIAHHAFDGCVHLRGLVLPEGLETIDTGAIGCNPELESITLPECNPHLREDSGSIIDCEGRLLCYLDAAGGSVYEIPSDVKSIESRAFIECRNLRCIIIPSSVEHIDSSAFSNCYNLETVVFEGSKQPEMSGNVFLLWDDSVESPKFTVHSDYEDGFLDPHSNRNGVVYKGLNTFRRS